ncbi:MAG: HD-GYP domain-containing protein [Chloroflexota bacterium]
MPPGSSPSVSSSTVEQRPKYRQILLASTNPVEFFLRDARLRVALLAAGIGLATFLTYVTGGTRTAMPQIFYVVIFVGGFWFGPRGGLLAGLISGLAVGPLMPINVDEATRQATANWVLRLGIFTSVGYITGWLVAGLRRRVDDLSTLSAQSIRSFVRTIDFKSTYTAQHSEKVAEYAVQIARAMDLPNADVERIYWAGLLHDVGKIRIPRTVLDKPARLDVREMAMIRHHPLYSLEILKGIDEFERFLPAIRSHHERWDGQGYPDGIAGEDIPFDGRVLAVADAFDAMTSNRPYRTALTAEEACDELRRNAGTQFDPNIVDAFLARREIRVFGEETGFIASAGDWKAANET